MFRQCSPGQLLSCASAVILFGAQTLMGQALRLDPTPVRPGPLGVDITEIRGTVGRGPVYAAVANSADNSVSVVELKFDSDTKKNIIPVTTVAGVPGPFAVSACRISAGSVSATLAGLGEKVLVTSPSDNSITVLQIPQGSILAKIHTGPQPYAAGCFWDDTGPKGVVSNLGDNTLVVVDLSRFIVTARISGVPAGRGLHGVAVYRTDHGKYIAAVAGTDGNTLTLVDLRASAVLTRIPARAPTSVRCCFWVASSGDNTVFALRPETLETEFTFRNVPNPQDFIPSGVGYVATVGGGDAVARVPLFQQGGVIITPGIPGAAGLAAYSWSGDLLPATTIVLITSPDSNRVFLAQALLGLPTGFSVAHGASFQNLQVGPGSLASLFTATATGVSQNFAAHSLPLPTTLGGVTLRVGGSLTFDSSRWVYSAVGAAAAALLFVGPTQINFQMPTEMRLGEAIPIQMERADGTTLLSTMRVVPAAPGIFTVLQNGRGQGAVLNQDNSLNGTPESILGARPAARGSVIQIFATGAGVTIPPLLAGEPAPASGNPLVFTQVQPTVTIGGKNARVLFSGMAPGWVGLWQINAEIPQDVTPGPAVPLSITAGGIASNAVTIAVQ